MLNSLTLHSSVIWLLDAGSVLWLGLINSECSIVASVAETTLTICCVVSGWWVQCHVLCQQWCCACWRWWNTESYEACCCTRDTQLGSVNFSCWKFLWIFKILKWRCWLGSRKGIRPVKYWVVGCWCGYLSGVRCRLAYGPADATATYCLLLP